ncbi:MAG: ATP-binding protein [Marinovum sp.]|nr:ATP-binding protein [Marinovum sp.]
MTCDPHKLHITASSSRFAVRSLLSELTDELAEWGLDSSCVSIVELVTAEVLNNVIEHAFKFEDGKPFEVKAQWETDELTLEIIDRGLPMPGLQLPDTATGKRSSPEVDVPVEDLPEGGWGWFLIRDLTRELSYLREENANHLVIRMDAVA